MNEPKRDVANEIAIENERLKRREELPRYYDLIDRLGTKAADYVVKERVEWIDLSADLLSAAESVLKEWENLKSWAVPGSFKDAMGDLYGSVMDLQRKTKENGWS